MNTNMASARYALPFNSRSYFMHVRDQQAEQRADKSSTSASVSPALKPSESSGAKFSRKMQALLPGKKEQRLTRADQAETQQKEERKQGVMRRLVGDGAMMRSRRAHLGRP